MDSEHKQDGAGLPVDPTVFYQVGDDCLSCTAIVA